MDTNRLTPVRGPRVDLPVTGNFPAKRATDAGWMRDVMKKAAQNTANGHDAVMAATARCLAKT
jgi:hypothetical protein